MKNHFLPSALLATLLVAFFLPTLSADPTVRVGAAAYGVTVYINGQNLGTFQNPVTPTVVDITDYIRWSGANILMLGLEG